MSTWGTVRIQERSAPGRVSPALATASVEGADGEGEEEGQELGPKQNERIYHEG